MNDDPNRFDQVDLQLSVADIELVDFDQEKREIFMEVIEAALTIKNRTQLFRWTQSIFQYLIGHDVLIYAYQINDNQYRYNFLTSSRYFNHETLDKITQQDGMLPTLIERWQKNSVPLIITNDSPSVDHQQYSVIPFDEQQLSESELKSFILHGFNNQASIVMFGRLHAAPTPEMAHALQLIMPYLHNIIDSVIYEEGSLGREHDLNIKKLSTREVEVIKWVQHGKTNRDISEILDISPLTVKNHVQNIIKKLSVQNRRQAALKALKLGLIEVS